MNAYLSSDIVLGMKKEPTVKDILAKVFDVVEEMTKKTRSPIKEAITA